MANPSPQGPMLHVPVLGTEVLSSLHIYPNGVYFDGTIGTGGHAALIIQQLSSQGLYIGIDRDEEALSHCRQRFSASPVSISLHHRSYHKIKSTLDHHGVQQVNGFLLDLGLSSCLLYTSPSPRDGLLSRMPSSA